MIIYSQNDMNIDLSKIKLIIWDLDDTFWRGTLSEGGVQKCDNIQLIKDLTDGGIVNSICSKNDRESAEAKLQELGILDYFVFTSIDWNPKGPRIAKIISDMGLRPENVLFIDDNPINLNEALHYSPNLMTSDESIINKLNAAYLLTDDDRKIKKLKSRLQQYKILEEKQKSRESFADNLSFLYQSYIEVAISSDCETQLDRIYELVGRTNQLNYTKLRSSKEELQVIIHDEQYQTGYVSVKDKYGDYGIIGFYAVKDNQLVHFLFSCRTIGQGIEQYVYATLNYPQLNVIGEVVNEVDESPAPAWINQKTTSLQAGNKHFGGKIVLKGPCDLRAMATYFSSANIITEFAFISETLNQRIEHHNHSINYLQYDNLTDEDKQYWLNDCIFNAPEMFTTHMYDKDLSLLFISALIEPNLGMYRNKINGKEIAFAEWCYPLTDKKYWEGYVTGELPTYSNTFTYDWLQTFSEKYEFVGRMNPERYIQNIQLLLTKISSVAKICICLGSEIPYLNNKQLAYNEREKEHRAYNDALRTFAQDNDRVFLLDVNKYIKNQEDYSNNINHYQRRIYFELAQEANRIIEEVIGHQVKYTSRLRVWLGDVRTWIKVNNLNQNFIVRFFKRIIK